jgi:hypothetical protein
MMDVTFNITSIADARNVCYAYASSADFPDGPPPAEGWQDMGDGVYRRLHPVTMALAHGAFIIGLSRITPDNHIEWLYRLQSITDAGIALLCFYDSDDALVPYQFTLEDVHKHTGLQVAEAHDHTDTEFDGHVRAVRMAHIRHHLLEQETSDEDSTTPHPPEA